MSKKYPNGTPCLCGDETTWHQECYRKQSEALFRHDPIFLLGFRAGIEAAKTKPPYPEFCHTPDKCAGLGSCPRDPCCCD